MSYLIAYDIASPGRLRRVARRLERSAIRVQKSVFRFAGDEAALGALLRDLEPLIEPRHDALAAWRLTPAGPGRLATWTAGRAQARTLSAVVLGRTRNLQVESER